MPLSRLNLEQSLQSCSNRVATHQGGVVCFANVHTVTEGRMQPEVARVFENAWMVCADGVPLVWASRLLGQPIASRVCGPDFMEAFLKKNPTLRYAFVGGAPGRGREMAQRFELQASIEYSPPYRPFTPEFAREDWQAVCALAQAKGWQAPDVVWVGLGAPKQERWMDALREAAPQTLFLGVGAAFDFLTGHLHRAPRWMQASGLEWLFRLMSEPRRLFKRYLRTNTRFAYYFILDGLKRRSGPRP